MLGRGWDLPAHVGIEAVPQGLILSTVDAALAIDVLKTIPAGAAAASVLALTHGVLMTMKLAQIKWIGMMILATSLAASGAIAVAYAAGQSPKQVGNVEEVTVNAGDQEGQPTPPTSNLTSRSQNPSPTAIDPFRTSSGLLKTDADSSRVADPGNRSIREFEVELKLALSDDNRAEKLSRAHSISQEEMERYRGKVMLIAAKMEGIAEDLSDEIDRLELELKKKDAEIARAAAQKQIEAVVVARNKRLNERKPGIVSEDEVTAAEAKHQISIAQMSIVKAEKTQVELRIQQLRKRVRRINEIVKLAEPAREIKP
jgi:hypothetical protein